MYETDVRCQRPVIQPEGSPQSVGSRPRVCVKTRHMQASMTRCLFGTKFDLYAMMGIGYVVLSTVNARDFAVPGVPGGLSFSCFVSIVFSLKLHHELTNPTRGYRHILDF